MSFAVDHKIAEYLERDLTELSISEMRSSLRNGGFAEEEIREIIREVDEYSMQSLVEHEQLGIVFTKRSKGIVLTGIASMIFGLLYFVPNKGFVTMIVLLACGALPLIFGLFLIFSPVEAKGSMKKSRFKRKLFKR
jgi:hypothetical protein